MSTRNTVTFAFAFTFTVAFGGASARAQHLLVSEAVLTPAGAEYVEIYNPGGNAVALANYYLSDNPAYSRLPCLLCQNVPQSNDFTTRFPAGATIAPSGVVVVAMNADTFIAAHGVAPTFELAPSKPNNAAVPDMLFAWLGSIGSSPAIADAGEWITLFFWDQAGDNVKDVDIIRLGNRGPADGFNNKALINPCIDGPDPDLIGTCYATDALTMPAMALGGAPSGFSHKRRFLEGLSEVSCNGNGITGHDETTENTALTWDGTGVAYTAPTPGVVPVFTSPPGVCFADINGSGAVDVDDLVAVILNWGACPGGCVGPCPANIAPPGCLNCAVDVDDLVAVILNWGACP